MTSFSRPQFFRFIIIIFKTTVIVCVSFFLCTGCVKFKYVPDIESIAVNVTYGKGNVQNGVIKGKPISCPTNIILLLIIIYYHKIVDVQSHHVLPLRIVILL